MHQLTRGIESVMQVVPSPDSRTYAFVAIGAIEEGRGGPAIYTIGDDGTRLTRVSQGAAPDAAGGAPRGRGGFGGGGFGEPQWSRDGRNIFYMQGAASIAWPCLQPLRLTRSPPQVEEPVVPVAVQPQPRQQHPPPPHAASISQCDWK